MAAASVSRLRTVNSGALDEHAPLGSHSSRTRTSTSIKVKRPKWKLSYAAAAASAFVKHLGIRRKRLPQPLGPPNRTAGAVAAKPVYEAVVAAPPLLPAGALQLSPLPTPRRPRLPAVTAPAASAAAALVDVPVVWTCARADARILVELLEQCGVHMLADSRDDVSGSSSGGGAIISRSSGGEPAVLPETVKVRWRPPSDTYDLHTATEASIAVPTAVAVLVVRHPLRAIERSLAREDESFFTAAAAALQAHRNSTQSSLPATASSTASASSSVYAFPEGRFLRAIKCVWQLLVLLFILSSLHLIFRLVLVLAPRTLYSF